MPELDPERLAIAEELQRQLASENELTPMQARAFVRGLQKGWDVPTIRWGQQESRDLFADAKRLIGAATIFRTLQGTSSAQSKLCYRRAGELLEWLTRGGDDLSTAVPLELLSAACLNRPEFAGG
jgi:hypothetical protein